VAERPARAETERRPVTGAGVAQIRHRQQVIGIECVDEAEPEAQREQSRRRGRRGQHVSRPSRG
jgi:hypothetical protein